ncbi:hypothetical protein RRG08_063237 [Elysia crispata]|uniref:Uncharacterized protein n=1 Tax=Elysia crispata TaxID=231223 RepID=A0AAE0Y9G2_9GAST|nr:hypothetical protein RRG08_063237 [Elysia crispata]
MSSTVGHAGRTFIRSRSDIRYWRIDPGSRCTCGWEIWLWVDLPKKHGASRRVRATVVWNREIVNDWPHCSDICLLICNKFSLQSFNSMYAAIPTWPKRWLWLEYIYILSDITNRRLFATGELTNTDFHTRVGHKHLTSGQLLTSSKKPCLNGPADQLRDVDNSSTRQGVYDCV